MAGDFLSLNLGADWIGKLWGKLQSIKNTRREELETINNAFGNPNDLAKYYIEPDCQDTNPADTEVEDLLDNHSPVMTKIDEFLAAAVPNHPGYNVLFVLGDAGMGKTALLTMLKLMHLTSFWPSGKECILKKLSLETSDEIKQISNKFETILLLDSLDEDPSAYGRVKDRLFKILDAARNFYRVIITCRTQFFPDSEGDRLERLSRIIIGGYRCRAKYLSFFDDKHVQAFLKKRFPRKYKIIPQKKLIEDAQKVVKRMGSLRCRPMLLAYIGDLMPSADLKDESSEFTIYNSLVRNWLQREHVKTRIAVEDLLRACEMLATELTMNQAHSISEKRLDSFIEKYNEMRQIKAIDIKGRSLLNRNSEGEYRFAHNSFREFLVARRLLYDVNWEPDQGVPTTELIFSFVAQGSQFTQQRVRLQLMNISHLKLHSLSLRSAILSGTNLTGAKLGGIDLQEADLSKADLREADLKNANLMYANLRNANLEGANLCGANLKEAKLREANLRTADLRAANLWAADLRAVDLGESDLSKRDLREADLRAAYLSKAKLIEANLRGAKLNDADLSWADLTGADLSGADLSNAILSNAIFIGANFTGTIILLKQVSMMKLKAIDISKMRILD